MTCPVRFKPVGSPASLRSMAATWLVCVMSCSFAAGPPAAAQDDPGGQDGRSGGETSSAVSGPTGSHHAAAVDGADLDAMNNIPAALRQAVRDLDHDSYDVRRKATQWLAGEAWDKFDVYEILEFAELSYEQRARLLGALRERLLYEPMGAIGISQTFERDPVGNFGKIRVVELLPGLPAERVLHLQDLITRIDGRRPITSGTLKDYVQRKRPGEMVTLTVERRRIGPDGRIVTNAQGEFVSDQLEFEIELGAATKLSEYEDRWRQRRSQGSNVRTERKFEYNRAQHDYGLPTRTIVVRGSGEEVSTTAIGGMADGHDAVLRTQDELRRVRSGLVRYDDMFETWERRRMSIKDAFSRPGTTAEERRLLGEVLDRMNELIERARPSWPDRRPDRRARGRWPTVL